MEIWIHHYERDEPKYFDSDHGPEREAIEMLIDDAINELWKGYKYTVHVTVSEDEKTCTSEIIDMRDDAQEIMDDVEQDSRYSPFDHRKGGRTWLDMQVSTALNILATQ